MTFDGREYALVMGSDVERDGMFLELDDLTGGERETVAEVFYADGDGSMALTEYREGVPRAVLAWLRDEAARRLPPQADAG